MKLANLRYAFVSLLVATIFLIGCSNMKSNSGLEQNHQSLVGGNNLQTNYSPFDPSGRRVWPGSHVQPNTIWDIGPAEKDTKMILQGDGNLVIYKNSVAVWSSNTWWVDCVRFQCQGIMHMDGNFALYAGSNRYWETGTTGAYESTLELMTEPPYIKIMTPSSQTVWDGVNGMYGIPAPPPPPAPVVPPPVAASFVTLNPGYTLQSYQKIDIGNAGTYMAMQSDGNLVIYNNGQPLWASNTWQYSNLCVQPWVCRAVFQHDGNFVVSYSDSMPLWNAGVVGQGHTLVLSDQAPYLQIKNALQQVIWDSTNGVYSTPVGNPVYPPAPAPVVTPAPVVPAPVVPEPVVPAPVTPAPAQPAPVTPAPVTPDPVTPPPPAVLAACPASAEYPVVLATGSTKSCSCSAAAVKSGGVYGDKTYSTDSRICRAALHAGVISSSGGNVTLTVIGSIKKFTGSTANGVSTYSYNAAWTAYEFSN